ncbi:hypothetical protein CF15_03625 [Pyrodictium occultum]|uniref:Uncharacterized protein n=1 Tax=Pyrodictium occultum TaxID=2309 RepID=A0A0V8RV25_PYROC|nr:hypothetical protein [Pyrodictium occultum]KSW11900.1 hypothetical protein CF15_03625 [Pyrodictium occultum]
MPPRDGRIRVDYERLAAELPLLMLYSLSYAGGNRAPHEALNDINRDEGFRTVLRESAKIASLYQMLVKKYGNTLLALEKVAERVASPTLSRIIRSYIASYILRGNPLDTLHQLAVMAVDAFEQRLREKVGTLIQGVELIATATVMVLLTVVLSSSISANYAAAYMAAVVVAAMSFAIALTTRVRILSVMLPRRISPMIDAVLLVLSVASLLLLVKGSPLYATMLAITALPIHVYSLVRIKGDLTKLSKLIYAVHVVTEGLTLRLSNIDTIVAMVKGDGTESPLIYALRTGRAVPGNAEKWHLAYLLSKVIASVVRSGSNAAKVSRIANAILESLHESTRMVFNKALVVNVLLASVVLVIAASTVYISKVFGSRFEASYAPFATAPIPASIDSTLAVKSIAIAGVGASFAIAYAVWGALAYNIAAPLIIVGGALLLMLS